MGGMDLVLLLMVVVMAPVGVRKSARRTRTKKKKTSLYGRENGGQPPLPWWVPRKRSERWYMAAGCDGKPGPTTGGHRKAVHEWTY